MKKFILLLLLSSLAVAQRPTPFRTGLATDSIYQQTRSASLGIHIGRFDTTWQKIFRDSTVWYTANQRRMWLAANGTLSAVFSTQSGSVIGGEYLTNGTVIANKLIASAQAFSSSIVFSDSSNVIVKWTSGYVRLASGTEYSIPAGNTGTMAGLTYVYLNTIGQTWGFINALDISTGNMQIGNDADGFTSTQSAERTWTNGRSYIKMNGTTYLPGVNDQVQVRSPLYVFTYVVTPSAAKQFSTNAGLKDSINANVPGVYAITDGTTITLTGSADLTVTTAYATIAADSVILLAVAKPASVASSKAFYVPAVGSLGINGDNILVNSINANHIIANTITTAKLDAITTDAIYSSLGTAVAGSIEIGSTNKLWLNYLNDGNLRIGGSVYANAPFQVSAAGALTATSATIKTSTGTKRVELVSDTLSFYSGGVSVVDVGSNVWSGIPGIRITNGVMSLGGTRPHLQIIQENPAENAVTLQVEAYRTTSSTSMTGIDSYVEIGGTGTARGISGRTIGLSGSVTQGIYGDATGGSTNWAGYFDRGNVYVANQLRVGFLSTDHSATAGSILASDEIASQFGATNGIVASIKAEADRIDIVSAKSGTAGFQPMTFWTNGSEKMRLRTDGGLLLGATTTDLAGNPGLVMIDNQIASVSAASNATILAIHHSGNITASVTGNGVQQDIKFNRAPGTTKVTIGAAAVTFVDPIKIGNIWTSNVDSQIDGYVEIMVGGITRKFATIP